MSYIRPTEVKSTATLVSTFEEMKSLGISVLIMGLLVQVFSTSMILLNYEVNTSYITEKFCENTDTPELECNGKCHLKKQIKASTDHQSESPTIPVELVPFVLVHQEISSFDFDLFDSELSVLNGLYIERNYARPINAFFRPPQV